MFYWNVLFFISRYIKALETMRQLRLKQSLTVKECQVELRYLKENKEKAQQIRETVAKKEAQLMASKDSVQQIDGQIDPLEVCWLHIFLLTVFIVSNNSVREREHKKIVFLASNSYSFLLFLIEQQYVIIAESHEWNWPQAWESDQTG